MELSLSRWYRVKPNCKIEGEFSNERKAKRQPVPSEYRLFSVLMNNTKVTFFISCKDKEGEWKFLMNGKMKLRVTLKTNQAQFLEEVDFIG